MAIEQIDASGWPAGETFRLLLLPLEPDELSERFGLVFEDDMDDLGPVKLAVVKFSEFGVVGLLRYVDAPFAGTLVHVDREADLRSARDAVLSEFGVAESEVSWIATDPR